MSESHSSTRPILYALGANLGIAVAKTVAAVVTGSGSMMAEAIHSFADSANQGLLFVGLARSKRPPDAEHPLGHGKSIFFWSFIVALMLFSMGGLFSVYEGLHKLEAVLSPEGIGHAVEYPWVAVAVLAVGLVLEGLSLAGALRESRSLRRGKTLWRWFRTSRESAFLVVIGEDLAALLGLLLALLAVLATMASGNPVFDALGSIAVGALLIVVAVVVGVEVKSLLIGESAEGELETKIRAHLLSRPELDEVLNLITLQLGPDVMVAVKARMTEVESVTRLLAAINGCERGLRDAFPQVRWVFFEPDVKD